MLSNKDKEILDEIIRLEGQCMNSERCQKCPFRSSCLPEFLNTNPPTRNQRFNMALDILAHHMLIDPESGFSDYKKSFRKGFKQNNS